MTEITKFVIEFFLYKMQEYFLMYTLSVMNPCAAQQSKLHPGKRGCPLGPAFVRTFAMSFIQYIFQEAMMSYKGS